MAEGAVRVLLVENDAAEARRIREALREPTDLLVDLELATDARAAVAAIRRRAPDVILLDLSLPDAPGLRALRSVEEAAPRVPVIALTDATLEPLGMEAVWLGAQDHFVKSWNGADQLVRAIRLALARNARRLRAEDRLRESDERHRRIVEATGDGIWMLDQDDRTVFVNARMAEMLGCDVAEASAQPWPSFLDDENRAIVLRHAEARRRGEPGRYDLEFRRKDGARLAVDCTARPVFDAAGRYAGTLQLFTDITERKREEERLARSEELFSGIFRSASIGIGISTLREGRILDVNERVLDILGYAREELIGRRVPDLRLYVDPTERDRLVARLVDGAPVRNHETRVRRRSGEIRDIVLSMELIRLQTAREPVCLVMVADVTDRRRAEETNQRYRDRLAQSQKIEAVGRLAGGVAHDFNNLLTVISGHTGLLLRALPAHDPRRPNVEEIRTAGDRAAALTRQLLAFSRKQVLAPRLLDLNSLVTGMERMLRRLIGESVMLETRLEAPLGTVRADPGQLEQTILNLALNSRDAMPRGGTLSIETGNVELDARFVLSHPGARAGPHVLLTIRDTGVGMTAAVRARAFEPFFTTKAPGQGTGLGLAMVYGIVKQSDGFISLYSEPGHGTTARIYLPRVWEEARRETRRELPPPAAGTETVLLVEDERSVRDIVRQVLHARGYSVLEAATATEALALASPRIDLLVADVGLPGMSGSELAAQVRRLHPGCRVLYISGYTQGDPAVAREVPGRAGFLPKPFTAEDFLAKVRDVLDAAPA